MIGASIRNDAAMSRAVQSLVIDRLLREVRTSPSEKSVLLSETIMSNSPATRTTRGMGEFSADFRSRRPPPPRADGRIVCSHHGVTGRNPKKLRRDGL